MYTRYLEIAAAHGFAALMGGLDYRASPDWASKLGISSAGLAEFQLRSIQFLRDVARPFEDQIPQILFAGVVGPRGDAYGAGPHDHRRRGRGVPRCPDRDAARRPTSTS